MSRYAIREYGALPLTESDQPATAGIQAALDACRDAGGGTVVVPAGQVFVSGSLTVYDNTDLHLEPGSELRGSERRADYRPCRVAGEYAAGESAFLIEARDAEYVSITGAGAIDGQGLRFMDGFRSTDGPYIREPKSWRPRLIGLQGCRHLTIRDVTLRNSASWCLHLTGCDDVVISGIRILNDLSIPNCDGIDPDHCTNVRISDCHIRAGDDCIVIKATRDGAALGYRGSHDITVANCTCISTSAALKIGTESHAAISNICFQNCVVRSSSRGLAIQLRDGGDVENVLFANCTVETRLFSPHWWGRAEPIYVTALPRNEATRVGRVRHVRFSDILCRSENGIFVAGCESSPIEDLVLDNVRVEIDKWTKWEGGRHDRRPVLGGEHTGLSEAPTDGVFIEHAAGVRLGGVDVAWGAHRQPYWGETLRTRSVTGLVVR